MPKFTKRDFASADFLEEIKAVRKEFLGMARDARAISKALQESKGFKAYTENVKKATETTNRFSKSEEKLVRTLQQTRFQQTEAGKQQALANERRRRATAETRKFAKAQLDGAKATKRFGQVMKSFLFQANFMANIMSSLTSFISRQFRRAIQGAIRTITGFDQAMADVRAITQATDEEFKKLRDSAKELGSTTKFTAVEIAGLTKEYAKLGFSVEEILNAEAATLSLAAATNTELARAAEVVGITIRQFSLNAREAGRVTDVMARSFTSSALDMEKFAEAMKFVGPAAKASNISLERTTAILGQLADAGISGSMAGTSLRQIMLALSKESGTFSEKIERAAESGLTLAGAADEVQKRAATALLVMADGVGTIDEFTEALEDAGGAAEEMADIQLNTLKGQLTLLKSAWDGLIITIGDSEGAIDGAKDSISTLSKAINLIERSISKAQEEETLFNKGRKEGRKFTLQTIPVLGAFFRILNIGRFSVNALDLRAKELDETIEDLGETADGTTRNFDGLAEALTKIGEQVREAQDPQIETLETLGDELKDLREKQKEASFEQIAGINLEIAAIEKKIEKFKDAGKVSEDMLKLLKDLKEEAKGFFEDEDQEAFIFSPDALQVASDAVGDVIGELAAANEERLNNEIETTDKIREANERLAQDLARIEEEKRFLVQQAGTEVFNFLNNLTDRRVQKLEEEAERGIISEKKLAEEKAKLARRSAIINKLSALFNIAIDTASGVIKYTSNPLTLPLVPFVIGVGIASAAAVLAEPIPKFAKGIKSSPEGPAIVGEKGAELMIDKHGHIGLTPDKPTLMNLEKGTRIEPADVTSQILKYTAVANGFEGKADDGMITMMANKLDRLERAIKNKPVSSSTMTPAGILTAIYKGNTTIKNIDKYFK